MIWQIKKFFNKKLSERSELAKKQIIITFVSKLIYSLIFLILVPLSINYLGSYKYGIWVTLTSIVTWFSLFDIGVGNGLRNKLAESVAIGDINESKKYISTAYFLLILIGIGIILIFCIINSHINWNIILNDKNYIIKDLQLASLIVIVNFSLNLFLNLINIVLIAHQKPGFSEIIKAIGQIITLILVIILINVSEGSVVLLTICICSGPTFVLLLTSFILYNSTYKNIRPQREFIESKLLNNILSIGVRIFVIQVCSIIMYQTANIFISHLDSPTAVTEYNVPYRYFLISSMIFGIIITPFWSGFTEARVMSDYNWMKKSYQMLIKFYMVFAMLVVLMLIVSPIIFKLWIANANLKIDYTISVLVAISVLVNMWNHLHSYLLNGLGLINKQLLIAIIGAIINIPMIIVLGNHFGLHAIIAIPVLVCLFPAILLRLQLVEFINDKLTNE